MAMTLDQLASECREIVKKGTDRESLNRVSACVQRALQDPGFVSQHFGPDNQAERHILYEDPELGFCILSHVHQGAKESQPHDHGPSWAVYGQVDGVTAMTDWTLLEAPANGQPGKVKAVQTYTLEPGMARAYCVGDLHSPSRKAATKLLRMEGKNMEKVKRDKFVVA